MTAKSGDKTQINVNWIKKIPIAHRGLHSPDKGIFENTLSAALAAKEAGYAIEIDLQPSADGIPMVFHDYQLKRMTGHDGKTRELDLESLRQLKIAGTKDHIPTLREFLDLVRGQVPIVLELKGLPGMDDGFVDAVARELAHYDGDVAIMSFHHHILRDARALHPGIALGLTAEGDDSAYEQHSQIVKETEPDFISYELANLNCRFVSEFTASGKPAICWTVRSAEDAAHADKHVDQITFEGFLP